MKYFKTYEAYRRGVNGVGSLKNTLAVLKKENILRYPSPEDLALAIRKNYEAITGEKYEDEVQMSMDDAIADIVSHFKLDGPEFMAAWDKVVKESAVTEGKKTQTLEVVYQGPIKKYRGDLYKARKEDNGTYTVFLDEPGRQIVEVPASDVRIVESVNEAKLKRGDKITIEFDDEDGDYKAGEYTVIGGSKGGKELEGMGIKIFMTDRELNSIEYTVKESVNDAYNNLEKIFGTDQETMDIFQGIEDNGTVKDMIEFIDEFGNKEMLYRYGIRSTAQIKKLAKTIMNESVNEDRDIIDSLNSMANTDLERIADYADMIKDRMSQGQQLDAWMYSKISDSVKNLNSVHDTMDGNDGVDESVLTEDKDMTFVDYLEILDQKFLDGMKAVRGDNGSDAQIKPTRGDILQNFTLFRNYLSALTKKYKGDKTKLRFLTEKERLFNETFESKYKVGEAANVYKELLKMTSSIGESLTEARLSTVHKAAKKGSYPAVIVVVQDGKVIHQEPVSTPDVAPATFNVMQEKYPKALLHLEDKTGKRLFSESVVTEAKYDKKKLLKAIENSDDAMILVKGKEYIIYNPNNGNDDNAAMWGDKTIVALDPDGDEVEFKYSDIESYNESRKINLKAAHLSSEEYQKAKKLKDFDKEDWEWNSKSGLYDRVNEAANVPSNIEKFAKERGVLRDVKQIARWAEKAGKRITGGTAIGKGYDTLVLDLTYQGSEVYFDTDTGKIKVNGEPVNNWKTFSKAVNESSERDGTEASDGKHKHDDHLEEDIEAMWKKAYGEKFASKYPGVAKIIRQRKITDKREIARIWQETYGENFKEEYPAMWDMLSK